MTNHTTPPIRRVLVALDASQCSRAVLHTAAQIAQTLGVALEGLFVEDINLLRIAELPVAREVHYSGGVRRLDRSALERDYRCLAQEVERWATDIARQYTVLWQFRVLRGEIARELMAAAGGGDLLSLGRYGMPICPHPTRVGSVARSVLRKRRSPLLLLHRQIQPGKPIFVLQDDAHDSYLLEMAVQLARLYESAIIALGADEAAVAHARAFLQGRWERRIVSGRNGVSLVEELGPYNGGNGGVILSHRYAPEMEKLECAVFLL